MKKINKFDKLEFSIYGFDAVALFSMIILAVLLLYSM